ncbi:hypothetical protein JB92DRAFT_2835950 [Gautieria morchelliformis]|nr:hypothetical protein JB92DRAFT_2835950 [Gautieria morchelliformis]
MHPPPFPLSLLLPLCSSIACCCTCAILASIRSGSFIAIAYCCTCAILTSTENKLFLRPPTTVPSASIIINPLKPGLSSHSTPGPSPFVPPTSVATRKSMTKTGDGAFFYPNKNLFAINYCRDHAKTTKGDFENVWKIVGRGPRKESRVVQRVGSVENGESAGIGEEEESAGVGRGLQGSVPSCIVRLKIL